MMIYWVIIMHSSPGCIYSHNLNDQSGKRLIAVLPSKFVLGWQVVVVKRIGPVTKRLLVQIHKVEGKAVNPNNCTPAPPL
jgi:hypothetical protein